MHTIFCAQETHLHGIMVCMHKISEVGEGVEVIIEDNYLAKAADDTPVIAVEHGAEAAVDHKETKWDSSHVHHGCDHVTAI